jgi:hypothetical protein
MHDLTTLISSNVVSTAGCMCVLQAWVTGVFFCFGVMAWLLRVLLLTMMKSMTWLNPTPATGRAGFMPGGHGASSGAVSSSGTWSLFSSSSSSSGGGQLRESPQQQQQQQQLPGCARVVSVSPTQMQGPPDSSSGRGSVAYGPALTYADAVSHGALVGCVGVARHGGGVSPGKGSSLKSPTRGGQSGNSTSGRVRFDDNA